MDGRGASARGSAPSSVWGSLFGTRREKFSLEQLRHLHATLARYPTVTDANKETLVETCREIAELMIWGDQHDESFFDLFVEKRTLAQFGRLLTQRTSLRSGLATQLLQTLCLMFQNIQQDTSIYYLCSNNHINDLIELDFDFADEEVLAYYVSFLKAISLKLNPGTVQFFYQAKPSGGGGPVFPLYTAAVRFGGHAESMVRAAVRTLTLNVFSVQDDGVRAFVLAPPASAYFDSVADSIEAQLDSLARCLGAEQGAPPQQKERGESLHLTAVTSELGDLLCYCNDILSLDAPEVCTHLRRVLWRRLVVPRLLGPLVAGGAVGAEVSSAMFVLSRLVLALSDPLLLNALAAALVCTDPEDAAARLGEALLEDVEATSATGVGETRPLDEVKRFLVVEGEQEAAAAVALLTSLLKSRYIDDALMDAAGVLPGRRQHKKALVDALTAEGTFDDNVTATTVGGRHNRAMSTSSFDNLDPFLDEVNGDARGGGAAPRGNGDSAGADQRASLVEALLALLCRQPHPHHDLLAGAGWLLRQLLPKTGGLTEAEVARVREPAATAAAALVKEIGGPWGDAAVPVLCGEWRRARGALERPTTNDDAVAALIVAVGLRAADAGQKPSQPQVGPLAFPPSFPSARALHAAAATLATLHAVELALTEGAVPREPPLAHTPLEGERIDPSLIKEGAEIELSSAASALPCCVAFERGRERSVYLTPVSASTSDGFGIDAALLLAEAAPTRLGWGVVRAVAPVVGAEAQLDPAHSKWLHLRVRSPVSALVSYTTNGAQQRKRLLDGRWTLAFANTETSAHAHQVVTATASLLEGHARATLAPLTDRYAGT